MTFSDTIVLEILHNALQVSESLKKFLFNIDPSFLYTLNYASLNLPYTELVNNVLINGFITLLCRVQHNSITKLLVKRCRMISSIDNVFILFILL